MICSIPFIFFNSFKYYQNEKKIYKTKRNQLPTVTVKPWLRSFINVNWTGNKADIKKVYYRLLYIFYICSILYFIYRLSIKYRAKLHESNLLLAHWAPSLTLKWYLCTYSLSAPSYATSRHVQRIFLFRCFKILTNSSVLLVDVSNIEKGLKSITQ